MNALSEFFDRGEVIALKKSISRRELLPGTFRNVNTTEFFIFDAVDGREMDVDGMIEAGDVIPRSEGPNQGRVLTPGEVGCLMSHREIWKGLLESDDQTVLVCEGDISWKQDGLCILSSFFETIDQWDIVYLHSHFTHEHRDRRQVAENCYQAENEGGGTLCYAINRKVAEYLLKISWPLQSAADGVTNWASGDWPGGGKELGFQAFVCYPFPCESIGDESTIYHGQKNLKERILNRLKRYVGLCSDS
jgi:GR25 family glycosyltransferase involved in LPS biosynthesis